MSKYQKNPLRSLGGVNFLISIHNTQNSSWQGALEWLDTGEKIHFRSALELIQLLDEAVESNQKHGSYHRGWNQTESTLNII